jgi:stearoyl-CoA desaturase (delta-9 desaturase)
MQNVIEFDHNRRDQMNWSTIIFVTLFHLAALTAIFTFSWQNLAVTLVLWIIASSWGVGIGYHRLLTHRGFTAPVWLTRFLAFCATFALQSGPITWVTTHRIHHAFTETERDPHSPRNGAYWAHIGWIFRGTAQHQPESVRERYSPDLLRDPFLRFLDNYYWAPTIALGAVLFAFGGWTMVVWAVVLRVVVSWHFTWMVNSVTHIAGSRRFDTRDDSRNNGLVALVTFGEGWHNNHHAHPRSAKHGLTWREIDFNWIQLRAVEKLGLIRDMYAYKIEAETDQEQELRAAA